MKTIIRPATINDKADWVRLNIAFMEYEIEDDEFWNSPGENDLSKTFENALSEKQLSKLFIIENDSNEILGFANLMIIFSVWSNGKGLVLDDLYIDDKFKGMGHGKETMILLEDYAKEEGFKRFQFQSEETNESAYRFYTKLGYESENMKFYIKHL